MLRKGARFVWGPPQEKAFEELKRTFSSVPILGIIRDQGELVLDCDCSNFAMGIVLSRWQKEADSLPTLRVLAYASKTLNDAQRNYCVTRLELTAIIFGLKHFRQYLLGRKFFIRSDHAALQYLKTNREPTGQLARYLDLMA
jgi:RNase H-like domain found in reverse transcriptase